MSEPSLSPIQAWLTAPMKHDVSEAIERLRCAPDVQQIAVMPDGRRYFWIARTVTRRPHRFGAPGKTFAIGLGCELRHASRLVYSAGLDLDAVDEAVPIGPGCKTCERAGCAQRAFPQIGRALAISEHRSTFSPYPVE